MREQTLALLQAMNTPSVVISGADFPKRKVSTKKDIQMGMEFENEPPPLAVVTVERAPDGIWDLTIEHCPYCGKRHRHGGGTGKHPTLGHRVSHCFAGGYILVTYGEKAC